MNHHQRTVLVLRLLWALPCSAVGVLLGLLVLCAGGSCRRADHTLEFALAPGHDEVPGWAASFGFAGITFGHVIVGQSHEVLAALRPHERVHVRQYERLGLLFFVAYPASSLAAWLRGRCPYLGNRFEQEAFGLATADMKAVRPAGGADHRAAVARTMAVSSRQGQDHVNVTETRRPGHRQASAEEGRRV